MRAQVVEGARSQGAGKIIGVDINNLRRGKGEAFGTTDFINPKEHEASISDMIKGITGGLGVDYVFECTGIPSMLNEAIEASKMVSFLVDNKHTNKQQPTQCNPTS